MLVPASSYSVYLTIPQIAAVAGISRQAVWKLARAGRFGVGRPRRSGKGLGYPANAVERWLAHPLTAEQLIAAGIVVERAEPQSPSTGA
ncbi:MAG: helix-turn-helix transcriptional regulator [Stellaceae bacterium]